MQALSFAAQLLSAAWKGWRQILFPFKPLLIEPPAELVRVETMLRGLGVLGVRGSDISGGDRFGSSRALQALLQRECSTIERGPAEYNAAKQNPAMSQLSRGCQTECLKTIEFARLRTIQLVNDSSKRPQLL
jgi:hypothetical protein